ncbi:hypothetical protein [Paenibacillus sp. FSL H3-0333]|uniref:hypothetical protein n=1 Tax=Paenibacillus sp. FSL H3-0333 TaxID=2921373 RepID=UPI0030F6BB60
MHFILCKKPQDDHWQLYSQESISREQALTVILGLKRNGYVVKLLGEDDADYMTEAEELSRKLRTRDELYKIYQVVSKV